MIRRLKTNILKELPRKTRHHVSVGIENESLRNKVSPCCEPPSPCPASPLRLTRVLGELDAAQLACDLYEMSQRSGQSAKVVKKKPSEMEKVLRQVQEHQAQQQQMMMLHRQQHPGGMQDQEMSAREAAQQRKSLLMQLFKESGMAKVRAPPPAPMDSRMRHGH